MTDFSTVNHYYWTDLQTPTQAVGKQVRKNRVGRYRRALRKDGSYTLSGVGVNIQERSAITERHHT